MSKNKAILVYISLILITIFSLVIPKIITNIQDKRILTDKYTISKKIHTLNENAKSVELIEKIYSKYNIDKYNVKFSEVVNETEITIIHEDNNGSVIVDGDDILNMFQELMKREIIRQDFNGQFSSKFITYRILDYDNEKIKYRQVKIFTKDSLEEPIASIEIENETNKIIAYMVKVEKRENNKKYTKIYRQKFCHELLKRYFTNKNLQKLLNI